MVSWAEKQELTIHCQPNLFHNKVLLNVEGTTSVSFGHSNWVHTLDKEILIGLVKVCCQTSLTSRSLRLMGA
jgi:hypothetical protein